MSLWRYIRRMSRIPLVAVSFALSNGLACGNPDKHIAAIAGTELVTLSGSPCSITVSPDERWLAFWELSRGVEHPYDSHLCTLELATSMKTTHKVDSAYNQLSSYGPVEPWKQVASGFQAASWLDGRCYVLVIAGTVPKWLYFTPAVTDVVWSTVPTDLTCSDCPPPESVNPMVEDLVGRWLLNHGRLYSLAKSEDHTDQYLYHVDKNFEGAGILRTNPTESQPVVQHPPRRFKNTAINALRISPNERYLAYGLFLKLRAPMPLPDQKIELHVYDLANKRDFKISSGYRYISNLIWSPDSNRLYFAGIQGENRAVYRVDVDKALAE